MLQTAPVQRLPVELWARIFVLGANFNYPYENSPFLFMPDEVYKSPTVSFQVAVSHVCHSWRVIATTTPSLWSWIHFHELPHIERAKVFLSRCKPRHERFTPAHLLDILISTVSEEEHERNPSTLYDRELETIFDLLVDYTPRWRSFHLYVRDGKCKATARKYLSSCGAAPSLTTLQLYHFEQFQTPDDLHRATFRPPVVCFSNIVPDMKNVSLIGVNMPWRKTENDTTRSTADNFKMDNLESIQLGLHADDIRPPYRYWEQMLRCSPELQHLSLHYSGPKRQDGTRPETFWPPSPLSRPNKQLETTPSLVSLPRLTHLSLTDLEECQYACDILERLWCEKVAVLQLGVMDDLDPETGEFSKLLDLLIGDKCPFPVNYLDHKPALTHFPSQPLPNIHHLHTLILKSFTCSFSALQALLVTLIGLKVLEVDFYELRLIDDTREAWQAFLNSTEHSGPCTIQTTNHRKYGDMSSTTCPCVLLPSLEYCTVNGLAGQSIIDVVNSRFRVNLTIQTLTRRNPTIPALKFAMPRYVVKFDEGAKGTDTVLDGLISDSGVNIPSFSEGDTEAHLTFIPMELKLVAADDSESVADESEVTSDVDDEDF